MFDWLLDFVGGSAWAYPAILGIVFVDAFFPLVPGETSVVTGAILASNDELHISLVFAAAFAGAVAGDNFSFFLGAHLSEWSQRRLFKSEKSIERRRWACRQLAERGSVIIVTSRFIPGGRTAATFSAGALDYPWRRFIAADLLAGALWAGFSSGLGWFGGKTFEESLWKPLAVAAGFALLVAALGELHVKVTSRRKPVSLSTPEERTAMHTAVRRYRVKEVDTVVEKIEETFIQQVKDLDGFIGYYVIDGGDGTMATVTVAETRDAVDESARRAAAFIQEDLPDQIEEKLDGTVGEVRVRAEP